MSSLRVAVTAAAVAAAQFASAGQKPLSRAGSPFDHGFDAYANGTMRHWKVPGLAIAVIDGDDVYAKGYGYATLPDTPATPETLWYGASTTKAFVAAAMAQFIDSKHHPELSHGWSTKVASLLRNEFVLQDDWATQHVTLNDAVSHSTGMAGHDASSHSIWDGNAVYPLDVVRGLRHLPMRSEPRTTYEYCNAMYVTLGCILEKMSGKWLGAVLRDVIWKPLGMTSTFFDLDDALDSSHHFADGYLWNRDTQEYETIPRMNVTSEGGAGAVLSNVVDYAKWVQCLLGKTAPLSASVHEDIRTPRFLKSGRAAGGFDATSYGLGWERSTIYGHEVCKHSGGMHAYGAYVYWLPELNYGFVSFANTAVSSNAVEMILFARLIADKLRIPTHERFDIEKDTQDRLDTMAHGSDGALDRLYPDRPETPIPGELRTEELAGTYFDKGYGNLTLREAPHPRNEGEPILVSQREGTTWRQRVEMHHVSGPYWIYYAEMYTWYQNAALAARFEVGVDGKVKRVVVDFMGNGDGIYFERVAAPA